MKLSDDSLGNRPRDSIAANGDVRKPNKQTLFPHRLSVGVYWRRFVHIHAHSLDYVVEDSTPPWDTVASWSGDRHFASRS